MQALFTDMLPIITIQNGMAFLTVNAAGHSICTSVKHFELFLAEATAKLALHKVEHPPLGTIVPFDRKKRPPRK